MNRRSRGRPPSSSLTHEENPDDGLAALDDKTEAVIRDRSATLPSGHLVSLS
jgi:hypothetical protein